MKKILVSLLAIVAVMLTLYGSRVRAQSVTGLPFGGSSSGTGAGNIYDGKGEMLQTWTGTLSTGSATICTNTTVNGQVTRCSIKALLASATTGQYIDIYDVPAAVTPPPFVPAQKPGGGAYLGTALVTFAVLGNSTVTNTGPSVVSGNLGLSPGSSVTGFPPGVVVNGTTQINSGGATGSNQAQTDLTTSYNYLAGLAPGTTIVADLGGQTLLPGTYTAASSAAITGTLTLNANGNANAVWIFQIGSTLTTAAENSTVALINGANAGNVYWQVGSSATLGTHTVFNGNILALASITGTTGAVVNGRLLASTAAVTLDTNGVTMPGQTPGPVLGAQLAHLYVPSLTPTSYPRKELGTGITSSLGGSLAIVGPNGSNGKCVLLFPLQRPVN